MVEVELLTSEAKLPSYAHFGDAGADLYSVENVIIFPGERKLIGTGIALAIPVGFVGLIHPRSGLAAKSGITVLNAPGTIDSGYRGEVKINLINHGEESFTVLAGDRIAQLVIQEVIRAKFVKAETLVSTERGTGGHGSTGVN